MLRAAAIEGDPRRPRAVGAAELVAGDVGDRGVEPLGLGEHVPEAARGPALARRAWGIDRQLGAQQPHQRRRARAAAGRPAPAPAGSGCETRSGRRSATSSATRPPIELPTRWARSIAERVHEARARAGEVRRVVAAARRASRRAEARAGRSRGPCSRAPARRRSRRTRSCCAPRPWMQITCSGPAPAVRSRSRRPCARTVVRSAAAAGGRRGAGTGPRSRPPGRGRRGPRGGGWRTRRGPTAGPRAARARSRHRSRSRRRARGVGEGRDLAAVAACSRTSQVRPTSPSRT